MEIRYVLALLFIRCTLSFQLKSCISKRSTLLMSSIQNLHSSLFSKVNDALVLKSTEYTDGVSMRSWSEGGYSGSCEWFEEVKGAKLTGVSKSSLIGPNGLSSATLDCWMGPAYSVPHMLLTLGTDNSGYISVTADYMVRGPTPIGTDQNIIDNYYDQSVIGWYDKAMSLKGAFPLPPAGSFSRRLIRSPVYLSVGGIDLSSAESIANEFVDRWVNWCAEAKQVEARQRGAMNGRDDKLRQYAFRAALSEASKLSLGADFSRKLAAGLTGPVAEAYVGGGS